MFTFKPYVFHVYKQEGRGRPKPRSGHRIVCNDKSLYCYGGFNPNQMDDGETEIPPLFKEIWEFNLAKELWELKISQESMPSEVASSAMILKSNLIVVHGGTAVPFGEKCNNDIHVYDIESSVFKTLPASGTSPRPQYGQAIINIGPYIYSVGGTTGFEYSCDVYRFDLRSCIWEAVYISTGRAIDEPRGRYRHELGFDGKYIFVFGGGTSSQVFKFEKIPAFDIINKMWMKVKTQADPHNNRCPAARRCHGLVSYTDDTSNSHIVVISGGYNGDRVFNDLWELNLKTLQWRCLRCVLPKPLYFHGVSITPAGKMYIFGGIALKNQQMKRTNSLISVWVKIPKLSEMCWNFLITQYQGMKNLSQNDLLQIGIPKKFCERLK